MSGKRQLSILSFTLRGKPPKKGRLQDAGPEKVAKMVGTLEEETEEETVQVEEEETVQVEDDETVQVEDDETVQVEDEETVQVEDDETVQVEDEETVQVEDEETVEEMAKVSEEAIKTKGRKVPGAATYKSSFNNEWTSKWPFITVGSTSSYYWCSICRQENSCAHQGVRDVIRHIESKGHQAKQQALKSTSTVKTFYLPVTAEMSVQEVKTRRAEVKVAVAMVQHNVSFAVADHFSPLYRECFKDSPTAQNFKSASTKTMCIINQAVAPHYRNELVMKMRENPFTLVTDGSNDTGLEKMNPLTVRVFDTTKVVHRFLDMCTTSGRNCGTADVIYKKINDVLIEHNIPWKNCVGLSVDNAPVNTGAKNSIAAKMLKENPSIYIHGCPCHIIHNTAKHAGKRFLEISGFDTEDLVVDVGYWFKGSTNRKGYLKEFCELHGSDYMEMLLYISVRWLSLEMCITRILQRYGPLTSYFKSLNEKQPRFRRLVEAFSNPLTEVYLLFLQATFPVFSTLNLLLQREKASIFQLYEEMTKFIKKLCSRFMTPAALRGGEVHDIPFKDSLHQLPDLMVLKEERQELTEMEEEDQYERLDFMTVETTSTPKKVQKTESNSYLTCHQCGKSFKKKYNFQWHTNVHKCHQCGKRFTCKENVKRHMNSHTGMKPFICQLCGACLANKQSLASHMKRHTGEKPFTCDQCGMSFIHKVSFDYHTKRKHSGENGFTCNRCGESFTCRGNLRTHMRLHTGENPFTCNVCGKSFSYKSPFNTHMRTHTGEKPFGCKLCGKSFTRKGALQIHLVVHTGEKPFPCDQCGKCFRQKTTLDAHMKIHTGESPYICKFCGKSFLNKSALNAHMRYHTGEKPFNCKVCGKSFTQKGALKIHMRNHTGEKPFMCPQCGKCYAQETSLTYHMGLHSKEYKCHQCGQRFPDKRHLTWHERIHSLKTFTCHDCGKSFRFKGHFKIHMRIHTGEKPFTCTHCGKSFSQNISLRFHTRLHTGEKPFTCLQCKRSFTYKKDLNRHLQTHGKKLQCSASGKRPRKRSSLKNQKHVRSGGRQFNCDQCNKTFLLPSHLQIHLKSHADVKPYLCSSCGKRFKWLSSLKWHQKMRICVKLKLRSHRSRK